MTAPINERTACFQVFLDGELAEQHFFLRPLLRDPRGYVSIVSLNWFHSRCLKLAFPLREKDDKRAKPDPTSWISVEIWCRPSLYVDLAPKVVHHATLWDAYIGIGYDYRKQTFYNQKLFDSRQSIRGIK